MASDPNNSSIYWCGGRYYNGSNYVMGVAKSTNGGSSWTRYNLTTSTGFAYAITVDPTSSSIVYAGGNGGLFKTTNGGANWSNITGSVSGTIYAISIDPSDPEVVYAGASGGTYKSTNGGSSWNSLGLSSVKAVLIDPDDPNTIYAGTASGVYKSTQGGSNWNQMNDGLDNTNVTSLGIDPTNYLFCGTDGGSMYRWPFGGPGVVEGTITSHPVLSVYPNPMRKVTKVAYQLKRPAQVKISVYDGQGRLVSHLVNGHKQAGFYSCMWNGKDDKGNDLSSGIYFLRFDADGGSSVSKVVITR
ncbi:MAG TPA: T9SS type A sorting domain-containing protein [bacterium (Candidatus Stahlbacteria)]|nr:T9SS type A sorting domain-containing protein [Candidatus Stahlbacteria bacterium]